MAEFRVVDAIASGVSLEDGESLSLQKLPAAQARAPQARRKKPSIWLHALSGTVGALLAESILFPVDTVKLRVQTAGPDVHGGFFTMAAHIVRLHGAGGLYKGLGGALLKESIHSMNFWLWHGLLFRYVSRHDDTSLTPTPLRLLLNLVAKQLNWLCTVPFEVVSQLNQLSPTNSGFLVTAAGLYHSGGVRAFYRGLGVSLLLAVNPAIMNTLITSFLRMVAIVKMAMGEDYLDARDHSAFVVGVVTGVAKCVATALTYPLIRAKVLQQTQEGAYRGILQVLRAAVDAEGFRGLYKGVLAMSFKTVLWNSLMMVFKHLLGPKKPVTPPSSPAPLRLSRIPLMAREPFPVEMLTVDKLEEILSFLKMERGGSREKVDTLERRVRELSSDLQEIKRLVHHVLQEQRRSNGRGDDMLNEERAASANAPAAEPALFPGSSSSQHQSRVEFISLANG